MFVIRISGKFSHPSALIVPFDLSAPIAAAVSRDVWNPTKMPFFTRSTRWASTPSSS
jgi:hypothetical protein